jgi:hypothetical protein
LLLDPGTGKSYLSIFLISIFFRRYSILYLTFSFNFGS